MKDREEYISILEQDNAEFKKQIEVYQKVLDDTMSEKMDLEEENKQLKDNWNKLKEFINYLEDEKDRLARECSNIYEDSLGHTRLVNEDIFDEINDVLKKYKEIIGDDK